MADVWKEYRRRPKIKTEMRPYADGEDLHNVSISPVDRMKGSPKAGDMIARNAATHDDQWLVAKQYFEENYEEAT
jgi:hypothetical protein